MGKDLQAENTAEASVVYETYLRVDIYYFNLLHELYTSCPLQKKKKKMTIVRGIFVKESLCFYFCTQIFSVTYFKSAVRDIFDTVLDVLMCPCTRGR